MAIIYIYSKCSTCQKALRFLEKQKISVIRKEITIEPPSLEHLTLMLKDVGEVKKLFNTSGQLYREMQLAEKLKSLALAEALLLLSQQGMLVKRPFFLGDQVNLLGFKEEEWSEKLGS